MTSSSPGELVNELGQLRLDFVDRERRHGVTS